MLSAAHVAKVSADDLAWLHPGVEPVDAARAVLELGPAVVLLTRGGDGATSSAPTAARRCPRRAVDVVDTIGAGDAFGAGFLAWWDEHGLGAADLATRPCSPQATAFAARVAALTCAPGASPPTRAELAAARERRGAYAGPDRRHPLTLLRPAVDEQVELEVGARRAAA